MSRFKGSFIGSLFEKTADRNINNMYTGIGLSKKGKGVAFMGMGTYGAYKGVTGYGEYKRDMLSQNTDPNIYALQSTEADGVGYEQQYRGGQQPVPVTSLDPIQVSGDIVFSLHNLRHGG